MVHTLGIPGDQGYAGFYGTTGPKGTKGPLGDPGLTIFSPATIGDVGEKGHAGLPGLPGKQGPQGVIGQPGLKVFKLAYIYYNVWYSFFHTPIYLFHFRVKLEILVLKARVVFKDPLDSMEASVM